MFDDFVAWSIFLVDRDRGVVVKVGQQAGLSSYAIQNVLLCIRSFDIPYVHMYFCNLTLKPAIDRIGDLATILEISITYPPSFL